MTDKRQTILLRIALAAPLAALIVLSFIRTDNDWIELTIIAPVLGALIFALGWLLDRYDATLTTRMQAIDQGEWEVWLNGIKLGTVTDNDYAAMQQAVLRDSRVAIEQFMNVGEVMIVVLQKLVLGLPVMVFWFGVGSALFAPECYADLARELQKAEPTTVAAAAKRVLQCGMVFGIVTFCWMAVFGHRFGFRPCYSEAVDRILRQRFNTPVEGEIMLCRRTVFHSAKAGTRR
jgi:hypothetical protein